MNTTFLLYMLLAILSIILLVILLTPKEVRVEYVKEVPYPNYFAIWPSPYYRDWTGASTSSWRPHGSGGRRVSYGMGSGWSSGGSHHGGGHGGGGHE
jgi:hypothetical protein